MSLPSLPDGASRTRAGAVPAQEPELGGPSRTAITSAVLVAGGIVAASAYGLLADDPYRDLSEATVTSAKAQDVCSLLVAAALLLLVRPNARSIPAHLVRIGLLAYVAYSYAIYLMGVPMNRVFLVYVVVEAASLAGLAEGLLGIATATWSSARRRLAAGTGWLLVVVAVMFASLWLSTLLPYAFGGPTPEPEGLGGAPYPVFVLDLVVVLPCIFAIGTMLLRRRPLGGPLAVVALVKIITLFAALWAGVVAGVMTGTDVELGPDAVPSLVMVATCAWLLVRWLRELPAETAPA